MKDRQRWQPEEDALLRSYVKQHGPKEWSLISQRMGKTLDRDPKSCLERWKNYLKPGIKKGSLTPDEQNLVISLQSKYGNKWKKIAAEVPGRTAKRLGKWWEVFKEKQMKQIQKTNKRLVPESSSVGIGIGIDLPETAAQGKYDHILDTFAEKYVQPVLSIGGPVLEPVNPGLPPWMINVNATPTTTSTWTCSSTTTLPSVSLTLSEPGVIDLEMGVPVQVPVQNRFFPVQNVGVLVQQCKELEEGKESWLRHKKEATWRLSRLEQQLESEKARRMREITEEIEAKIKGLREEEMLYMSRMEGEYREQVNALQRDEDGKEAKLMEVWSSKQVKLGRLVQQIGVVHSRGFSARR